MIFLGSFLIYDEWFAVCTMAWIACQDAVHCIEPRLPSQMQVIESSKILVFSFRTDFPVDSAGGMLAGEVPQRTNATC